MSLQALISDFYELPNCNCGGPLHIVLDDLNVEDANIEWCVGEWWPEWVQMHGDDPVIRDAAQYIAQELLKIPEEHREGIILEAHRSMT